MKMYFYGILGLAMMANSGYAQETSSKGSLEVQASFSTLKAMINEIRGIAVGADTKAVEAKEDARVAGVSATLALRDAKEAMDMVQKIQVCNGVQKYYDPSDPDRNRVNDCVGIRMHTTSFKVGNKNGCGYYPDMETNDKLCRAQGWTGALGAGSSSYNDAEDNCVYTWKESTSSWDRENNLDAHNMNWVTGEVYCYR